MVEYHLTGASCCLCGRPHSRRPSQSHEFWTILRSHVTIDEVSEPGRFLGRERTITKAADGKDVFLSMREYCVSAVGLYLKVAGDKPLKSVATPYLDSELNVSDWEARGELGEKSASILMKILWLARLSRPDLSHGVTKLASGIMRWSINHDKMLYRLVSYMNSTLDFGVLATVRGTPEAISLHLYTDADLGGDICTMKSHSGIYLVVECPNGTHFPISWSSRRQQCVSKSTTESELVAMNEGLYTDAIPVQTVRQLVFGLPIPLILHEDNQACIHILRSGYSPKLKSMSRTHKLSIAGIHETINDLGLELRFTESADQQQICSLRCYQGSNSWTPSANWTLDPLNPRNRFPQGGYLRLRGFLPRIFAAGAFSSTFTTGIDGCSIFAYDKLLARPPLLHWPLLPNLFVPAQRAAAKTKGSEWLYGSERVELKHVFVFRF